MAELRAPRSQRDSRGAPLRRGSAQRLIIGGLYLAFAVGAAVFALLTSWVGRLNGINLLGFALAIAGTLPVGLLALQGDYVGSRGMDEGQREMRRAAQSDAFSVAYIGLVALFFGYTFVPAVLPHMQEAIGVLLLAVAVTWLGGYMWRRWRQ
jgi:hypothetical protein